MVGEKEVSSTRQSPLTLLFHIAEYNDIVATLYLSCAVPYGNRGCQGGNVLLTYQYVIDTDGVDLAIKYPYRGIVSSEKQVRNT